MRLAPLATKSAVTPGAPHVRRRRPHPTSSKRAQHHRARVLAASLGGGAEQRRGNQRECTGAAERRQPPRLARRHQILRILKVAAVVAPRAPHGCFMRATPLYRVVSHSNQNP
eukprot:7385804-Prymnesium_polylepis.1